MFIAIPAKIIRKIVCVLAANSPIERAKIVEKKYNNRKFYPRLDEHYYVGDMVVLIHKGH